MKSASPLPFGLTPKAILAFLFPLITALAGAVVLWASGGDFDVTPIKVAAGGVITSGLALLGAWIGKPSPVVIKGNEEADLHDAVGA